MKVSKQLISEQNLFCVLDQFRSINTGTVTRIPLANQTNDNTAHCSDFIYFKILVLISFSFKLYHN